MATVGNTVMTMADLAKSMDPDGSIAMAINLLAQKNEILDDIPWLEGNLPTGHRTTVITGLPSVGFRRINAGVPRSKSNKAQIDEPCSLMQAYSDVDVELLKLSPNPNLTRLNEDSSFIEAFNQKVATTMVYGSLAGDPASFNGFSSRYATGVSGTPYQDSMINAGGAGSDNTSMWLVVWGNDTVHGIYPKGTAAGFEHNDKGEEQATDANGNIYYVERSEYIWRPGLAVRDWQYVIRIANIDWSELNGQTANAAKLIDLMTRAIERIPDINRGRAVFYTNRGVRTLLRLQIRDKVNNNLTFEDVMGRKVVAFDGIPVRVVDALGAAEAAVAF